MASRKPDLAAALLAARGPKARARALVEALRAAHAHARREASCFAVLTLRTTRPAAPAILARLAELTGVPLPPTLAALYRLHSSVLWRWALPERDPDYDPQGGLELLSPTDALRRVKADERLAGSLPFARIEPAGDLYVLRRPRGGGEPSVAEFLHDEEGLTRRAASFDAWLDRSLAQAFVEPFQLDAAMRRALAPALRCFAGERGALAAAPAETPAKPATIKAPPTPEATQALLFQSLHAGRLAGVQAALAAGWTEDPDDGEILLSVAAQKGHEALGLWLLARRPPDVRWTIGGMNDTLLHAAAEGGSLALVQALLAAGAEVDAKNAFRQTPLHLAATTDVARALLAAGASTRSPNKRGEPPADTHRRLGRKAVARLLDAAG